MMSVITAPKFEEQEALVALSEATGFFNAAEVQIVREMLSSYFEDPASEEYIWIVYRESEDAPALGFACYGPAALAVGTYDLYWIAVAREIQGKKIGSLLLNFVEEDLAKRGARQLYVETSDKPQYASTRAFYERRAYTLAAHFRDYFAPGDGKVVYLKAFPVT
jgi:GNAT superfamily N-acetyltransferase